MDSLKSLLHEMKNEYKLQISINNQSINRLKKQIREAGQNVDEIDKSIDYAYMALSSSQTANISEHTEIDILNNLISEREEELEILEKENARLESRLELINESIESEHSKSDLTDVTDRLKFILSIIDTDNYRAKTELKDLISKISMAGKE